MKNLVLALSQKKNPSTILLKNGTVHVWSLETAAPCFKKKIDDLLNILTVAEKKHAQHFHNKKIQERFILTRSLLRILISQYLKISPKKIIFTKNKFGKLNLAKKHLTKKNPLKFNLAHSGNYIVYAFSYNVKNIGIDIEKIRPSFDSATKIAKRFFSKKEIAALNSLPKKKQNLAFFHCWARKEAIIKALGKGLYFPLHEFSVAVNPNEKKYSVEFLDPKLNNDEWSLFTLNIDSDYAAALAVMGKAKEIINFKL